MSFRSGIVLLASLSVLAALMGCGSSSSTPSSPGQSSTTLSELNGTYAFAATGSDSAGQFFTMAGSFAANGSGAITGGAMDYNDPGSQIQGFNLAIMGGSYSVGSDGRGTAKLTVTSLGALTLDFVLSSTSHGLITRFDSNGSGSGTLDLQTSPTQSQLAGSYAFSFTGLDGSGSMFAAAGAFTLDASGNVTAGVQDSNDALSVTTSQSLTGTVTVGSGSTPGTAQLIGPFGTLSFDVYAVDQTHLKLIETDSVLFISGDAFTQQNASIPSGAAVFSLGGLSAGGTPLAAGGFLTFNNSAFTISGGSEDLNNASTPVSVTFSGTYSALAGGRSVLTLSGFTPAVQFAIYPSSGGLLMVETDPAAVSSGTMLAQTATSFSTTGGYGFNLSAANSSSEVDDIAAFTATSGSITGTIDENDEGIQLSPNQTFGGSYTPDATGSGRGTMALQGGSFNADYYVASSSTVLLIETDASQVGVGEFLGQNGVGQSAAAIIHAAMARSKATLPPAQKKKKTN